MVKSARIDAWLTWTLSAISLTGSILILISFFIATQARKKADAARKLEMETSAMAPSRSVMRRKSAKSLSGRNSSILIRNLALMDFVWFASAFTCGNYWLFSPNGGVPKFLCGIVSPLMVYTRLGSLLWSCVITYDVYAKVCRRGTTHDKSGVMIAGSPNSRSRSGEKVFLSTDAGASDPPSWWARLWHTVQIVLWRYKYGIFVNVLAVPVTVVLSSGNADGYCEPGYESVGSWKKSVSLLVLPIFFGIAIQLYVYFKVREKMGLKAYPQSVRKRRRRIMYHYILVSALCWMPTFLLYVIEAAGYSIVTMDIVARATLFTSGFFNFLVYGMHDPFLIRAFRVALSAVGLSCVLKKQAEPLKADKDHNRIVMFNETTIGANADISKDKRAMIRDHRLSKADKAALYKDRPDLDPSREFTPPRRVPSSNSEISYDSNLANRAKRGSSPRPEARSEGSSLGGGGGRDRDDKMGSGDAADHSKAATTSSLMEPLLDDSMSTVEGGGASLYDAPMTPPSPDPNNRTYDSSDDSSRDSSMQSDGYSSSSSSDSEDNSEERTLLVGTIPSNEV